jgi:hypothetical protein
MPLITQLTAGYTLAVSLSIIHEVRLLHHFHHFRCRKLGAVCVTPKFCNSTVWGQWSWVIGLQNIECDRTAICSIQTAGTVVMGYRSTEH